MILINLALQKRHRDKSNNILTSLCHSHILKFDFLKKSIKDLHHIFKFGCITNESLIRLINIQYELQKITLPPHR